MRRTPALILALAVAACTTSPSPYRNAELGGTVSYREGITYGPDATLAVYLIDASGPESRLEVELQKLDNPAPGRELLAATSIEGMIPSPTRFSLPVPVDQVDPDHDYRLKAVIVDRGKLVMATAEAPLVLTKGRPLQVDLTVVPIGG